MLTRLIALSLSLAVAGCATSPQAGPAPTPPPAQPTTQTQPPPDTTARSFRLDQEGNTLVTETYMRTATRFSGEMIAAGQVRVEYGATIDREGRIGELSLSQFDVASGSTTPSQRATVTIRGDSLISETMQDGSVQRERVAVPAGAVLYINPSIAFMEQIILRARAMGALPREVPVVVAGAGGQTMNARVSAVGTDSVSLTLGPADVRVRVDSRGHVLGGSIPAQGVMIVRVD